MQKAFELMNIKLSEVISDITGKTGLAIITNILQGNHDPQQLAAYKDFRIKASHDTIVKPCKAIIARNYFLPCSKPLMLLVL